MDDNKWITEKNIKFSLASEDDIPELKQFLRENFFIDEPIMRNMKMMEGSGWVDNFLRNLLDKIFIINPMINNEATPASIVARSTLDNSIVGCRIGEICSRANAKEDPIPPVLWIGGFGGSFRIGGLEAFLPIPEKIIDWHNFIQHVMRIDLNYGKRQAFEELQDTDKIYFASNVCASSKVRGCGLGTELVKRGYDIAKKAGCGYTYILASSLYSQKIFHKLGNLQVLHEIKYEDYKYDKKGRPFLIDPREHEVIQVLAVSHLK